MLKRIGGLALLLAAVGALFQIVRGALSDSEPMWDTSIVLLMGAIGACGGYWDSKRQAKRDQTTTAGP